MEHDQSQEWYFRGLCRYFQRGYGEGSVAPETKAIYLETPSNPMMKVADIQAIADLAHENGCLLIVDNTFLSPYFQKPLTLGADIVVHSGTKYLEGHNDTLSGFLVVKDNALYDQLYNIYKTTGACLSAIDSWLLLRGIKTLAVRMETAPEECSGHRTLAGTETGSGRSLLYRTGFQTG